MGYRKRRYKDGVLISEIDTRVLSEVQDEKRAELRKCLSKYLEKTDWEVVREADSTSRIPVKEKTVVLRKRARQLAKDLENQIDAATHLDDLERFNPDIEDLM